jgi:hypothetical protein
MKTLEQTLEELQHLEQLFNDKSEFSKEQVLIIAEQLESAFNLAQGELNKIEAENLIILEQQNEDQNEK